MSTDYDERTVEIGRLKEALKNANVIIEVQQKEIERLDRKLRKRNRK